MTTAVLNSVINAATRQRGQRPPQINVQAAKVKISELFIYWMALPETQDAVSRVAQQMQERGGHLAANEIRALLEGDMVGQPGIAVSGAAWGERRGSAGEHGDGDRLHGGTAPFASPPRSPRQSPARSGGRAAPPHGAGPLAAVDELDFAHRQGAMSPHGSPRHGRSPSNQQNRRGAPSGQSPDAPPQPAPSQQMGRISLGAGAQAADEGHGGLGRAFGAVFVPGADPRPHADGRAAAADALRAAPSSQPGGVRRRPTGEPRGPEIPQFFFADKTPTKEEGDKQAQLLRKLFETKKPAKQPATARGTGMQRRMSSNMEAKLDKTYNQKTFHEVMQKVCLLPKWMTAIAFKRILAWEPGAGQNYDREREAKLQVHPVNTTLTYQKFKDFYDMELAGKSKELRLFELIKADKERKYIIREDIKPIVQAVLQTHPGLEFLKSTPDFQERYAETVQIRIFFCANLKDDDKLTWGEWMKSSLPTVLHVLDSEQDINVCNKTEYFSYEHFYVLYCKFWELDTDHDFLISKEDLSKYGNYSLTNAVVDRIFSGKGRHVTSTTPEKMSYEDFIWFCLCEEDKQTPQSLEYWFRCCDLDTDGVLSGFELQHFFQEQKERMESSYQETIAYEDILCQMIDMIHPRDPGKIRLSDLKGCRLSGNFFNSLFNLNKFIAFEQRDPFVAHAEKQLPEKTDWDRFAKIEYERMSHEAGEQEEGMNDELNNANYWRGADAS